jgi:outer membrane protein
MTCFLARSSALLIALHLSPSAFAQSATVLTIEQAMELSEKNNFNARIASASVDEAKAKQWQTAASMGPSLTADSTQVWIDKSVNKLAGKTMGATSIPSRINTGSLTVAQPIVPLGPLYMKLKSDMSMSRVAELDEVQARRAARFGGAEAFIRARKALQFKEIAESSLKLTQKQRDDANALFRAGRIGSVDLLRFEMALADSQTQLEQANNMKQLAFLALAESIGSTVPESISLSPNQKNIYNEQRDGAPEQSVALTSAASNRSELKGAAARIEMLRYYKLAADFDYIPMVNAFAKYERDFEKKDLSAPLGHIHTGANNSVYRDLGSVTIPKKDIRDNLTYGLIISWKIWDWGGRVLRSSEFAASTRKAELAKQALESGIRMETTQSLLDLEYAKSALKTSQTAIKFADEAYRQQNLRFQNGSASSTDIITAERDLTRIRGGLASAEGDLDLAWLKLLKATGRDLASQEGASK